MLPKLSDFTLNLWSQILSRVPTANLLIQARGVNQPSVITRLQSFFTSRHISKDRLILQGPQPFGQYLQTLASADILLDTFPFNGHTTTCHALWMGTPVITLAGDRPISRVGLSLLHALDLTDLAAHTPADYVDQAVTLATDIPRLRELQQSLGPRMQSSPLTDGAARTRDIEKAYRVAWEGYCTRSAR
jgi:predicted O-linked N-acetylglucosamine transferase (SPINDLY family)